MIFIRLGIDHDLLLFISEVLPAVQSAAREHCPSNNCNSEKHDKVRVTDYFLLPVFCVCADLIGSPSGNWRPLCSIKMCECWMYRVGYTSYQLYLLVLVHQCTWMMELVFVVCREWSGNSIPPPQAMSISYNVLQRSVSFPLAHGYPVIYHRHRICSLIFCQVSLDILMHKTNSVACP